VKKRGRKRSSRHLPAHINQDKLPDRVWYDKTGAGKWMLKYKDDATGKWRSKRICSGLATLAEIWQATEAREKHIATTFADLSNEFQQTLAWRKLSPLTQRDYIDCHNSITTRKTARGALGSEPISQWTTGLVRKYRDKRGEESESRANKELAYIKRVFSWAYEYEKIKFNPATGVKKLTIKPRQHYAEDKDYQFMLQIARQSNYWYVPYCMEIAYLCRMRLCEVLDLTDANQLDNGLLIKRRKNSKTNITEWTPRLRDAWDQATKTRNDILQKRHQPHPIIPDKRYIFISARTGNRIQPSSLKTALSRIGNLAEKTAAENGIEFTRFTFHDLKRKGISDTTGDKLKASGHRSANMLNVYDVKPDLVKPAGDNKK